MSDLAQRAKELHTSNLTADKPKAKRKTHRAIGDAPEETPIEISANLTAKHVDDEKFLRTTTFESDLDADTIFRQIAESARTDGA